MRRAATGGRRRSDVMHKSRAAAIARFSAPIRSPRPKCDQQRLHAPMERLICTTGARAVLHQPPNLIELAG